MLDRYDRQLRLPQIGPAGQERLSAARVLLIGCGALGSTIADQLARSGVGFLRLVDRDIVEMTNLHRQVLYTESDAAEQLPKAQAAARRLAAANSTIQLQPFVSDVNSSNIEDLAGVEGAGPRVDLILDGTDNVETRYLINDLAVKHAIPWVYGAAVGTEGRVMAIRSGGPCLRCVFPIPPSPGELPTCDTAGVLGAVASIVAAHQVIAAMRILVSDAAADRPRILAMDPWAGRHAAIDLADAPRDDCPCCGRRNFEFLNTISAGATSLCGRDAVQVRPRSRGQTIDLADLASRLAAVGVIDRTAYLLRCRLADPPGISLIVFPDARVIVHGTADLARARSLVARFVGA